MPYFLWALGDGICRSYAEEAIRKLGDRARPFLSDAANSPNPSGDEETPSSLQRRRLGATHPLGFEPRRSGLGYSFGIYSMRTIPTL